MSHRKNFVVDSYETTRSDPIGVGSFAEVFAGQHTISGQKVAIKVIDTQRLKRKNAKMMVHVKQEVAVMQGLIHINVVRLFDIKLEEPYLYMVLELCQDDMSSYMKKLPNQRFSEERARFFAMQLRDGLEFLHEKNIIHRDLKPQNLLLASPLPGAALSGNDVPYVLKIADFGFARELTESLAETMCGSPLYMAPEILRGDRYSKVADLWSVGAILYALLFGQPPFVAETHVQLHQLLERNQVNPPADVVVTPDVRALFMALLQKDTNQRLSWIGFFRHVWLAPRNTDTDYIYIREMQQLRSQATTSGSRDKISVPTRSVGLDHSDPSHSRNTRRPRASTSPIGSLPTPTNMTKLMAQSTLGGDRVTAEFLDNAVVVPSEDELVSELEERRLRAKSVVDQAGALLDQQPAEALALYVGVIEALQHALLRAEAACVSLSQQQQRGEHFNEPYQPIRVTIALGGVRRLLQEVLSAAEQARADAMPSVRRRASSNAGRSPPALAHSPRLMLEASRHPASQSLSLSGWSASLIFEYALVAGRAGADAELEHVFGKAYRLYSKGLAMIQFLLDAAVDEADRAVLADYEDMFEKRLEATSEG